MKTLFDKVSAKCSNITTRAYSTSFSLGIYFLNNKFHTPIYSIYGFVRFADEIVDSFEGYDKVYLLNKFKCDAYEAIEQKISLNPILNSFQQVVHQFDIEMSLIDCFLNSMEMDLQQNTHDSGSYKNYILGSAEAVGLMCLRVFTEGDDKYYQQLKPSAMKLGSAFQKINFLRDLKEDYEYLGRTYFPEVNLRDFSNDDKCTIEKEIGDEFEEALAGIRQLPSSARGGVYLAYIYYKNLFYKIKSVPAHRVMNERIRISNSHKIGLMFSSMLRLKTNML